MLEFGAGLSVVLVIQLVRGCGWLSNTSIPNLAICSLRVSLLPLVLTSERNWEGDGLWQRMPPRKWSCADGFSQVPQCPWWGVETGKAASGVVQCEELPLF